MSEKPLLRGGQILTGSLFSEPMRVESVRALPASAGQAGNGPDTRVAGLVGTQSERFRKVTLTTRDLESLTILDARHSYEGDGRLRRLGLQAYSLGIAYEFTPYFGLSISRVDPLPHQLEAITLAGNAQHVHEEIEELKALAGQAQKGEDSGSEAKLLKLKELLQQEGFFPACAASRDAVGRDHPEKRLLVFTEFKDTLDCLVERLKSWGFRVGSIHGGMKPGSRDERGKRPRCSGCSPTRRPRR
jgi:hypothetical protein